MKKQISEEKAPKKPIKKIGFSLLELSIALLVIGLLVAGITKGRSILLKSKINSARALTNSSTILLTADLALWFETTLETSIPEELATEGSSPTGNLGWSDSSGNNNNANATTTASNITYQDFAINNLPAFRFTTATTPTLAINTLRFNSATLSQKNYTIFVVEQRRMATTTNIGYFLSLGRSSTTQNSFGYSNATSISDTNGGSFTVNAYSEVVPRIVTFVSSSSANTRRVFVNGSQGATVGSGGLITAASIGLIGASDNADAADSPIDTATKSYYNGDIAEIIIYSRALTTLERNEIQTYLSKKYSIKVATSS